MPAGVLSPAEVQSPPSALHALSDFAIATKANYRHVVFTSAAKGNGRAVNLSPAPRAAAAERREPELTADERRFVEWLFARCGLDARDYRAGTIKRQLGACLRACGVDCASRARGALARSPERIPAAIGALVIGVTGFFRDAPVFDALRDRVIPDLLGAAAESGRRGLRVWSAGCSDGSELYSIAMLLAEAGALRECELIGSDCRPEAVARASRGTYGANAAAGLPAGLRERYLVKRGEVFHIRPDLRAAARWDVVNILSPAAVSAAPYDLILCRNVSIYLAPAATARVWEQLAAALRPGGALVLGKAERPVGIRALEPVAPSIYRLCP